LTHIGGPTVLVETAGWRILTDPTFDPAGRRYPFALGTSSVKTEGPALTPDRLGPVDAVLLSHDHHADNLDTAGRNFLQRVPIVMTTASGARRLGSGTIGLKPWEERQIHRPGKRPLNVTATPARHGPPLSSFLVGDATGFAVQRPGDRRVALWMSGDTVYFRGLRDVADRLDVEVALIHLGAVRFPITGSLRYTMNARDAGKLLRSLRPAVAVPVHHEGWSHFSELTEAARRNLRLTDATLARSVRWIPKGAPVSITPTTLV
jgi:L-ascorbate metabolism protein UlaG (beta-lactamase superfamily)